MSEKEIIFGSHLLESLTTGMYSDSRMIFREYVQNSCDAIDVAVRKKILHPGEGRINITLHSDTRTIAIADNGIGISSSDFERVMMSIGDSDKRIGDARGYRGIGRLGGLGYCKTLRFTAKFRGENIISTLECDAEEMRRLFDERDSGFNRYTASEVFMMTSEFKTKRTDEADEHYFIVELEGIKDDNKELLNYSVVKEYLSFTAPLPYSNNFEPFRQKIHIHAEKLKFRIDEYDIFLNGDQLFKEYTASLTLGRGKGTDMIYDLAFFDFRDINYNLIAWMWFGLSNFKGAISEGCTMRGIRLRKGNIQIGDENTLRKFFSESRAVNYFIGEIFCVSDGLKPTSQRDYFEEKPERETFENLLRDYFRSDLSKIFHEGSVISSSFKKINEASIRKSEFSEASRYGDFPSEEARIKAERELHSAEEEAQKAREKIDTLKRNGSNITIGIIMRAEENARNISRRSSVSNIGKLPLQPLSNNTQKSTPKQKLLEKVFDIIRDTVDKHTADTLIRRISDWFRLS